MRIDAYTHFIPQKFFDAAGRKRLPDIGKRMREIPCIHDLDARKKVVDTFPDYAQVLSHGMPPLEMLAKGQQVAEYAKAINDGFADICAKNRDHFPGWVAQGALGAPDLGFAECERAIKNGALGVQIYTNVGGKPLDDPTYEPFFALMEKLDKPIWLHPARAANFPDYLGEQKSKYEIWWAFGWSYDTAARDGAAGVLEDHGQISEAEDHHAPFRRHRADAGRPHRSGLGSDSEHGPRTKTWAPS